MHFITRLLSPFAKKLRKSEVIVVFLLTALEFYLCFWVTINVLIFSEILNSIAFFYFKLSLNHAREFSLAKFQ